MTNSRMETPLRRVRHYGSAHEGTTHFWRQRLTAMANIPLVIASFILIVSLIGKPYAEVVATLSSPFAAVLLILLIVSITVHMRLGVQVVIEDYIHTEGTRILLLAANTFFAIVIAALSVVAILKLALGG
jgi:succinate dehydrogenase / fumarate reductase membrane anchor subunit